MAGESQFSLFGQPTPEEVRRSIGRAGLQDDIALAQVPALRAPGVAMGQAGRMFGNVISGEDPRVSRARQIQVIQQKVQQIAKEKGINFADKPEDYMKIAANTMLEAGMVNEAYQVLTQMDERAAKQASSYKDLATAQASVLNAQSAAELNQVKAQDFLSKMDTRSKQLIIDQYKAQVYGRMAANQDPGNSVKMQQWKQLEPLLDKVKAGVPLTPGESAAMDQLGKIFSLDQVIAKMVSGGLGLQTPPPPGGLGEDLSGMNEDGWSIEE